MHLLALQEIGRGFPSGYRFGHTAHKHVDAELLHELGMEWSIERMRGICCIAHGEHSLHAHGNEKLIEGHRVHEEGMNTSHTKGGEFLQGELQQRTSCHDMQFGIVFLEKAQSHDGFGAGLYLVEEKQGLAGYDGDLKVVGEFGGDEAYIKVALEEDGYGLVALEVDFCKMLELSAELSHSRRLANLTCSTKQEWLMNDALLPFQEHLVDSTCNIILHSCYIA